jgi:hypothetical protein
VRQRKNFPLGDEAHDVPILKVGAAAPEAIAARLAVQGPPLVGAPA